MRPHQRLVLHGEFLGRFIRVWEFLAQLSFDRRDDPSCSQEFTGEHDIWSLTRAAIMRSL